MSAGALLLALLAATLKGALLLALAGGIVAALGRAPARARHSIWVGALVGILLVPVLAPWVPDWAIAALPAPQLTTEQPAPIAAARRAGRASQPAGRPEPVIPAASSARGRSATASVPDEAPSWRGRVARVLPATWLLGLWLLGCGASLAWFVRSLIAARRLGRGAIGVDPSWRRQLAVVQRLVGLRREVTLLRSGETATPMTWGWLRPVVLLPARSQGWSEERRRIVLLHELLHVRRADWLVRLLARLACSIYWFNPMVWAASRRLAVEQEIACDEEVVDLGTRPSSYAGHLLAIARSLEPATAPPAHALDMARRSQMEGRLMSILDGNRRLRGGRKLAILALLLIAGLVPALAAIEPWVEEQEPTAPSRAVESAASLASGETQGLARVLGELEAVERRMEPFAAELESLESEMEPIERELEGIEVEMEPVEVELEAFETELEPFEAMIEAVEIDMEPHLARLEAIEAELEPFEERLEAMEIEMKPLEDQLEAIEVEMAPFERQLEEIEVEAEPLERELERLSEQMEPLTGAGEQGSAERERLGALLRRVHERLAPLHERMGATHQQLEPLYERMSQAHQGMEPLHQRMGAIHEEMSPVYERMAAVHQELEPLYERMSGVHRQMEPVFERMSAAHERMRPFHERMGERHQRMEPYHRKMGEIHERTQPLLEEMEQRHRELEQELGGLIERMLAREFAGVTAADTDYAPATALVMDAVSLRVDDGRLRIRASSPELRDILDETLGAHRTAPEEEFGGAVERFVRALG
ncbi:MAG: M56 family metallopeptidase, partial [Thermoanaerobaculia bacterium]